MQNVKWFLQLSRPRFWFYLFGPFLLGAVAGYRQLDNSFDHVILLGIIGIFFTFPANLLIYGVNDLFDYETDKHNPKKKDYETLIAPENRRLFVRILLLFVLPILTGILASLLRDDLTVALWSLAAFMSFGIGYSAPPVRAKTKPFLDALFNVLYIFPGFISYAVLTGSWPVWPVVVSATFWVMAMHAFSAVPDIQSDKKAGIKTVATILGRKKTILFCFLLYFGASILIDGIGGSMGITFSFLAIIYMVLMTVASRTSTEASLFKIYKVFPLVNVLVGVCLFFGILLLSN